MEFDFLEYSNEKDHLKQTSFNDINERDDEMKNLIDAGLSNVKIGETLGISEGAVRKRRKAVGL